MSEEVFAIGLLTGTLSAALLGIVPALIVVLLLITTDLITGVWAACKTSQKIESHKLRKTAYKLLGYLSIITLSALIDGAVNWSLRLGSFAAGFLGLIELTSIIENFGKITGNDVFERLKNIINAHSHKEYHEK